MNEPIEMQVSGDVGDIPMTISNGGDSTDYITHGELMAILANYVPRNEFDNGSIVRWKGGQRNV